MKSILLIAISLLSFTAFAQAPLLDSTRAPSTVITGGNVGTPTPPVCNTATQMLHWNGSNWQCIANPGIGAQPLGKGAVVGVTTASCPSGTSAVHVSSAAEEYWCNLGKKCTRYTPKYLCVKN